MFRLTGLKRTCFLTSSALATGFRSMGQTTRPACITGTCRRSFMTPPERHYAAAGGTSPSGAP